MIEKYFLNGGKESSSANGHEWFITQFYKVENQVLLPDGLAEDLKVSALNELIENTIGAYSTKFAGRISDSQFEAKCMLTADVL